VRSAVSGTSLLEEPRRFSQFVSDDVRTCHFLTRSRGGFDPATVSGRLLLTKSEAAEQLGVSVRTIERLISAGRLPLVHVEVPLECVWPILGRM
jgi:hypothetical protein